MMAGLKGRSGGRRLGSGAKKKADLVELHTLIDSHVGDADWASILGALLEKAKQGDVQAFRELRACRFGQIPLAVPPSENEPIGPIQIIEVVHPCTRQHVGEERGRVTVLSD